MLPKIHSGSVFCAPAVKVVTMTSSKDSAKARRPPATSDVAIVRERHVAERLPAVGPEVHRRRGRRT
jgi:hypothetical protein